MSRLLIEIIKEREDSRKVHMAIFCEKIKIIPGLVIDEPLARAVVYVNDVVVSVGYFEDMKKNYDIILKNMQVENPPLIQIINNEIIVKEELINE